MISWHQKTVDLYRAKIGGIVAEAQRVDGEWWACAGNRARGPLSNLEVAMDAAAEIARDLAPAKA